MNEVRFAVGDADAGLRDRLDEEINAFNAAATGYHDGRMLSVAVRGDDGDLRAGLYGSGAATPNAGARRAIRTATTTFTW